MESRNFWDVTGKLFLKLVLATVACLMVSICAFAMSNSSMVRAIVQCCCLIFVIALIYSQMYKTGDGDRTLVNTGHRAPCLFRGLWIGLSASVPFLLAGVILVIAKIGNFSAEILGTYQLVNAIFYPFNQSIFQSLTLAEASWGSIALSLTTLAVPPLLSMFSYMIGYERFSFLEKFLYRKRASLDEKN